MTIPTIAIVNRCSVLSDASVQRFAAAFQIQVSRDLALIWDQDATIIFVGKNTNIIPAGVWQLLIEDTSPEADAAGFHELTPDGYPIGHAYVKDSLDDGMLPTVTVSHEGLELLVDPRIDQVRFEPTGPTTGRLRALEIADPPEGDQFSYPIDLHDGKPPVPVTAFVTRAWFQPGPHRAGTVFSHPPGIITKEFELLADGYIGVWEPGKGWSQQFGPGAPGARAINKKLTSRTMRRFNQASIVPSLQNSP